MAIQRAAGNYWMTRTIQIMPETFQVLVVLDLYSNAAAFQAGSDPQSTIQFLFPPATFTNAAINNIKDVVEQKVILQPAFSGATIVS